MDTKGAAQPRVSDKQIAQYGILDIPQEPIPVQMFPPCEMLAFLAGRTELKIKNLDLSLGASFGNDIVALPRAGCIALANRLATVPRYEASRDQRPAE